MYWCSSLTVIALTGALTMALADGFNGKSD